MRPDGTVIGGVYGDLKVDGFFVQEILADLKIIVQSAIPDHPVDHALVARAYLIVEARNEGLRDTNRKPRINPPRGHPKSDPPSMSRTPLPPGIEFLAQFSSTRCISSAAPTPTSASWSSCRTTAATTIPPSHHRPGSTTTCSSARGSPMNDTPDAALLAGAIIDTETGETFVIAEAERRLGSRAELERTTRFMLNAESGSTSEAYEHDG